MATFLLLLLLFVAILSLLPFCLSAITMQPSEKETLFQVMDSMSPDRVWRVSNPEPCTSGQSWPGIECKTGTDNYLHVTRLDFGFGLNPRCMQNATFPSLIFSLPHLQSLFFMNCFNERRTSLSFPVLNESSPNSYNSLQQLSFKSNPSLTGKIPAEISFFKSLQVLTLSQNNLSAKIPDSISSITSLIHLDLSYNSITGTVPAHIGLLRNLAGLDLSYNSLSGSIPASIGNLGQLQKLDLSSNKLTGTIPEAVRSLSDLSFLALNNNRLSGKLPNGLYQLQNLQYFIMDDNPMFVPLPSEIGNLTRLQELRLANSGYSGSIPVSFTWLTNLSTLSLENNKLTGQIPVGLTNLGKMYHLNLSRNMLNGVVPFNAGFVKRLGRNMDLSGNTGLCINGSDRYYERADVGVGLCGDHGSSTGTGLMENESNSGSIRNLGICQFRICSDIMVVLGFWGVYCYLL
ncbi:receptor like protein 29 [Carex rostrata]